MIVSDIANWDREKHIYASAIREGLEYIRSTDFSGMLPGRYDIQGDLMFALLQEVDTQPKHERVPESHQTYVDIQYLLEGEERIGVARADGKQKVSVDKLEENDYLLYEGAEDESEVLLKPGTFAVFFPADLHRPCCSVEAGMRIRKVVIKIHKQLWLQGSGA